MKVLCKEQRTPDWIAAHKGMITASAAERALARRGTKGRRLYVERIADDLEGVPDFDDHDVKPWFTDGVYYESWARGWYSFRRDVDVHQIGFIQHDEYSWLGCSPDGMVGWGKELEPGVTYIPKADEGLVEFKYRSYLHTYRDHAKTGFVPRAVKAQVQTQMLVTGCRWCDYVNYWRSDDHDKEKGHIQRIERDDAYIENTLLPAFLGLWQDVQEERERREEQRQRARRTI